MPQHLTQVVSEIQIKCQIFVPFLESCKTADKGRKIQVAKVPKPSGNVHAF